MEEWVVFEVAPWDAEKIVARASDGRYVYPHYSFQPETGHHYFVSLTLKTSSRGNNYYTAREIAVPLEEMPIIKQLIQRVGELEFVVTHLFDENKILRDRLAVKVNLPDTPVFSPEQIRTLFQQCSLQDLLGFHKTDEAKLQAYRRAIQVIHPDKRMGLGAVLGLVLDELTKRLNHLWNQKPKP